MRKLTNLPTKLHSGSYPTFTNPIPSHCPLGSLLDYQCVHLLTTRWLHSQMRKLYRKIIFKFHGLLCTHYIPLHQQMATKHKYPPCMVQPILDLTKHLPCLNTQTLKFGYGRYIGNYRKQQILNHTISYVLYPLSLSISEVYNSALRILG